VQRTVTNCYHNCYQTFTRASPAHLLIASCIRPFRQHGKHWSHVDSDNRHRIWHYVRTVRRSGVSVLLSSIYLDEVEALCDHVVVLDSGRVVGRMRPNEPFRRAGWWVEGECPDDGFPELERERRQQ
jgi:hypothetical protein